MNQVTAIERFAIQQNVFDKAMFIAHIYALNCERLSVWQMKYRTIDEWPPENVLVRPGGYRIEAERSENEPSRHLTKVVVTHQSVRRWLVLRLDNLFQARLRFHRCACEHVKIGKMMAGFVTVDVLADHSGDIFHVCVDGRIYLLIEHGVELGNQSIGAAQQVD